MAKNFDLGQFQVQGATGFDAFFSREGAQIVTPTHRRKVASIQDLKEFIRVGADQLVHKSERDLWSIKKEGDGSLSIERQFDDNGQPLKF